MLKDNHVSVVEDATGRPALDDPGHHLTAGLVAVAGVHWLALAWELDARQHGNRWTACDVCGEAAIVTLNAKRADRACLMTPGCPGRHRRPSSA